MGHPFDHNTWRDRIRTWWQSAACDLHATTRRYGVSTAYGLLTASALLPLVDAYASEPGKAVTALVGLIGGVGSNLVANLVQDVYDKVSGPEKAEQEVLKDEALRAEYCQVVKSLDALTAAHIALGDQWQDFYSRLCDEDRALGGALHIINTGNFILGDQIVHGDLVQGDKWQIILGGYYDRAPDQVPPETRLQAYLRSLTAECCRLPLGVVDPRFVSVGHDSLVALDQVYVDLDVVPMVKEESQDGTRTWIGLLAHGEGDGRTPLLKAIAHPTLTRFVLLGDPGSGKTTFVNYLSYALASDVGALALNSFRGLLPVRLILRDVAARCISPGVNRGDAAILWEALRLDLVSRLGDAAAAQFWPRLQERLWQRGGMILLDGLDEVPESDHRRRCLLEAVADLAVQLPASRILITARPYAYTGEWRLAGFGTLSLAPFDDGQVRRFVECWYQAMRPAMGWDEVTARGRGGRLLNGLAGRPYLADLAVRPLLLTLMATLHASWGQLPEDRADLYEETVKLLLSRWQRAREARDEHGETLIDPGIARALQVPEGIVRAALHRLAYEVHLRQGADPGRAVGEDAGPADVSQAEVLVAFALLLPEDFNPKLLLSYLETRAGLLIGRAPGVYAFPHRSFQEYLAACFMADGVDFARNLCRMVRHDVDWWRQVFLLGVGKARQGGLGAAIAVVNALLPEGPDEATDRQKVDWQAAVLAGQALLDLRFPDASRGENDLQATLRRVRQWLAALLETSGVLSPCARAEAGDLLGRLGDPRPGVSSKMCLFSTSRVDLPDIVWCRVPAGPFRMGSSNEDDQAYPNEKPQHTLCLPEFYIARCPITNDQYRPFVDRGGYDHPQYWTSEGWAWRTGVEVSLPSIGDENSRKADIGWLAQRPRGKRDQPFWWGDPHLGLPNRPVVGVTWYEALAYCRWLEEQLITTGEVLRVWCSGELDTVSLSIRTVTLPSEAEWEKAARGTDGDLWPWGSEWAMDLANTREASIGQTSAVGCFPDGASSYGCLDMAGNVWQWTRSKWGHRSIHQPDYGYPYDPSDGREDLNGTDWRVVRGGSWYYPRRGARCMIRVGGSADDWDSGSGFRVTISLA